MPRKRQTEEKPMKASAAAAIPQPVKRTPPVLARILKKVPRDEGEFKRTAKERKLAGTYRVIHGSIEVPLPESEWKNPDGSVKEGEPRTEQAKMGDEVYFGDEDAMRILDADLIEPLDTKPSRVGKVHVKPKLVANMNAVTGPRS